MSSATSKEPAYYKNEITDEDIKKLEKIFDTIEKDPQSDAFLAPVDYIGLNILDYPQIITHPMDLGTVKKGRRARGKFKVGNNGKNPFTAKLVYPEYVVEPIEELQDVTKERTVLLVVDTKNLPVGVTKDSVRLTSDYGIVDIPFKVTVK